MTQKGSIETENEAPDWELLKDLGNAFFKGKAYEEAVKAYSQAIEANKEQATLYSNRAAAYLQLRRYELAALDACKAVEVDPLFVKAYRRLFDSLGMQGRFTDAVRALNQGLMAFTRLPEEVVNQKVTPLDVSEVQSLSRKAQEAQNALSLAREHINREEFSQAEKALKDAITNFPDCPVLLFTLQEARVVRDPDGVSSLLSRYSVSHSNDSSYLYLRALTMYYSGQKDLSKARAALQVTLQDDPDNDSARSLFRKIKSVEGFKKQGNDAYLAGRSKEADNFYSKAIDVDATNKRMNGILCGNRSAARMQVRNYQGALADCTFAINNGNDAAKLYRRRSEAHENLKNFDEAKRDMQQAAQMDSSYQRELQNLEKRVKLSTRKDYYGILGLSKDQSLDENTLKRAYKRAALQWHPDKWQCESEEEKLKAEANFKDLQDALAILSDPRKKSMYDQGILHDNVEGSTGGQSAGGFGRGFPSGATFTFGGDEMDILFSMMGGSGGMGRRGGGRRGMGGMGGMGGFPF